MQELMPFCYNFLLDKDYQHLTPEQAEVLILKSSLTNQNLLNLKHFDLFKYNFETEFNNEEEDEYEFYIWRDITFYNSKIRKIDTLSLSIEEWDNLQQNYTPKIYKVVVKEKLFQLIASITCYRKREIKVWQHISDFVFNSNYKPSQTTEWYEIKQNNIPQPIASWLIDYALGEVSASIADKRLYQ